MTRERLQKIMAASGVGSRRACEEIISQGRVKVDGHVITKPGTLVDPDSQAIACDGIRLRTARKLYYLLNKPRGVICSTRTTPDKPCAIDYAPKEAGTQRLFTIGRLDVASEGALILTNDGELCHLLTHPRFGVDKTYRAEVEGVPTEDALLKMRKGVWLAEGRTSPIQARLVHKGRTGSTLELSLQEGRNREVRRICARVGHEVQKLVRIAIGPVSMGRLPTGAVRSLTSAEIKALQKSAQTVIRLGGGPAPSGSRAARHTGAKRTRSGAVGTARSASPQRASQKAKAKRATDARGKRGAERSASSEPRRTTSRSKTPARGKPASKAKSASSSRTGARGKPASRGKSASRSKPSSRGKTTSRSKPASRGKPAARGKTASRGKPAARGKPASRGKPALRGKTASRSKRSPRGGGR